MKFIELSLAERANLLWQDGKFLATAFYNYRKINLYSMEGDFFEVWYDSAGNLIEKIIPMSLPELFMTYAQVPTDL